MATKTYLLWISLCLLFTIVPTNAYDASTRDILLAYFNQQCVPTNTMLCVTVMSASSFHPSCTSSYKDCKAPKIFIAKEDDCASCSELWCDELSLCTNDHSLCHDASMSGCSQREAVTKGPAVAAVNKQQDNAGTATSAQGIVIFSIAIAVAICFVLCCICAILVLFRAPYRESETKTSAKAARRRKNKSNRYKVLELQ